MTTQDQYNFIVANNRLSSYEERKAKHQANLAEAAKRHDDPDYVPNIDKTAYLQPEVVDGFLINADALPAGETIDLHLHVDGVEQVLTDFCPHYDYGKIGEHVYRRTGAKPEQVSTQHSKVKRNGDGIPASAMTDLGLHLPIWKAGEVYEPGTVVIHQGDRYLKLDDGDNSMPDAVAGGWEQL